MNGVPDFNFRWPNGSTLNVKFQGGSQYVRSKVIEYSKVWENFANIKFRYVNSGTPDILISFVSGDGSWSNLGKTSQQYARSNTPSMNFGWFDSSTSEEEFRRTTLHEFGHALGLHHEHQHPEGNIQWNKPVVYNYYTSKGWTIGQIDDNIFTKYEETLSNFKYDSFSIMHYPIPQEFTLNGYNVGWNSDLSPTDKTVIMEMYPFNDITNRKPSKEGKIVSGTLNDFSVEHNVFRDDYDGVQRKGMEISIDFNIENAKATKCRASAYFMTKEGVALKEDNGKYRTRDGDVSSGTDFEPRYSNSRFKELKIFLPYDEFELDDGEYSLKFRVIIWDEDSNDIIRSGYYGFTYSRGIILKDLETIVERMDTDLKVSPKFSVKNAKEVNCQACVFFYDSSENPLRNEAGEVSKFCKDFKPGYDTTSYNEKSSNLSILIPYNSIPIPMGEHQVKYFVALFNGPKQFGTGNWQVITLIKQ
ncbi:MAG: M12 family metallopeptidase [Allomuricauda sp.]